jgi:hypothetical protein
LVPALAEASTMKAVIGALAILSGVGIQSSALSTIIFLPGQPSFCIRGFRPARCARPDKMLSASAIAQPQRPEKPFEGRRRVQPDWTDRGQWCKRAAKCRIRATGNPAGADEQDASTLAQA